MSMAAHVSEIHVRQVDIETAVRNATLKEGIYMKEPDGSNDGTDIVMKLLKSIYGLTHASKE